MESNLSIFALTFAAISSFAALTTSLFVYFQVRQSNWNNRITVLLSFQERFATEEMARAIRLLYRYKEEHGENFAQKFARDIKTRDGSGEEVNLARRKLSTYYLSISQALRVGVLDDELALTAMSKSSAEAFLNICIPMRGVHNGDQRKILKVENIRRLASKI